MKKLLLSRNCSTVSAASSQVPSEQIYPDNPQLKKR